MTSNSYNWSAKSTSLKSADSKRTRARDHA